MMFHETHNLAGYMEGALPPDTAARVERHLEACRSCRAALADMRAARSILEAVGSHTPEPRYDSELWSRVRAQIAPAHPSRAPRRRWALAGGSFALAGAAVCLAMLMNMQGVPGPQNPAGPSVATLPSAPAEKSRGPSESPRSGQTPSVSARSGSAVPRAVKLGAETSLPTVAPPALHGRVDLPPDDEPKTIGKGPLTINGSPSLDSLSNLKDSRVEAKRRLEKDEASANWSMNGMKNADVDYDRSVGNMVATRPFEENRLRGNQSGILKPASPTLMAAAPPSAGRTGDDAAGRRPESMYYNTRPTRRGVENLPAGAPAPSPAAAPTVADSAERSRGGSATTVAEAPDIVSDRAPALPAPPNLSNRVPERAAARVVPDAIRLKSSVGAPREATGGISLGVSTVMGHNLFAQASDAFAKGKEDVATHLYRDALSAGLGSGEGRVADIRLGDLAMKANDAATAVKHYTAALRVTRDADTLTKLGDAYEKSGNGKAAADAYKSALALAPGSPAATEGLGRVKGR